MFGYYLKYMRLQRGIKQVAMADKLFIAPCTLSHYENGTRLVPYTIMLLAAEVCDYKIQFIDKLANKVIVDEEVMKYLEK